MSKLVGTIAVLLLVLVFMPHLFTQLYPPIANSLAVRLWWVWLALFAITGYRINSIPSVRLRMWLGMPVALPAIFLCPLALYHWGSTIILHL